MIANNEQYRESIKHLGDHIRELVYVHNPEGNTSNDTGTKNENQPIPEGGYLWEHLLMAFIVFLLFLTCYLCALWNQKRTKVRQLEDMKCQLKIKKFRNIALHHHLQVMNIEALQESSTISPSQDYDSRAVSEELLQVQQNIKVDRKEEMERYADSTIATISIGSEDDWQHSCAICYEQFIDEDDIASSTNDSCIHYYHVDCILSWLTKDSNNHSCPICRDAFVQDAE